MADYIKVKNLLDRYEDACDRDVSVNVNRRKKAVILERMILPGISAVCVCRRFDCGFKFTVYPGVNVPEKYVPAVLLAIARVNNGMIRGSFGIDDDSDVYFENCLPAGDVVDYDIFLREAALGPKMVMAHMGDIVKEIGDRDDKDTGDKDGERYLINDDKEMRR